MMAFLIRNPNPKSARVGDCVIRAISIATGQDWERVYVELTVIGFMLCDMPSSNAVWAKYLEDHGFDRYIVNSPCPTCYTVRQFCLDHPKGTYIIGTGTHAVAVVNGDYIDTWDSGDEVPMYYFSRRENK